MKNVIEVGQKLVGFWGAMYPIDECVVEWVSETGNKFKMVNEEGDGFIIKTENVRGPYAECNGVGVYFA
jgi:hypothetical protein